MEDVASRHDAAAPDDVFPLGEAKNRAAPEQLARLVLRHVTVGNVPRRKQKRGVTKSPALPGFGQRGQKDRSVSWRFLSADGSGGMVLLKLFERQAIEIGHGQTDRVADREHRKGTRRRERRQVIALEDPAERQNQFALMRKRTVGRGG